MNLNRTFAPAAWPALLAAGALAQPHRGDILLTVTDDRIRTGITASDGGIGPEERVFQTDLGVAAPNFTADPGFDSLPGTFVPGSRIGFTIQRAVREWNGADFHDRSPAGFEVSFATLAAYSPPDDTPVTGFTLSVGSNGQWHRHFDYTLMPPADAGVYLLELTLWNSRGTPGESEPFWIVFNQNSPREEADAATRWVRENLIGRPCIADFNGDGGVDGGDVEAFFVAWEAGGSVADVNRDGGVDGADVEYFFVRWEAGGCE